MSNAIAFPAAAFEGSADLTMSSFEIAQRTGKRHADVLRDFRNVLEQLGATERSFASSYTDTTGRSLPCFRLPKRECLILVSGYSVALRAAIIDRWAELEAATAGPALPNFADPAASARAWAERYEGEQRALAAEKQERTLRIAAQAETEALKPAAAVDALADGALGRCDPLPATPGALGDGEGRCGQHGPADAAGMVPGGPTEGALRAACSRPWLRCPSQARSHVPSGDEPVLAAEAAFGFQQVSEGICDGVAQGEPRIALSGHEVGPRDVLDEAAPDLRRRHVRRCDWGHAHRSSARTKSEHVTAWKVRSRCRMASERRWRGRTGRPAEPLGRTTPARLTATKQSTE